MMLGNKPRYRYEIQLIPEGGQRTKEIVNVRTEYIADELQASYKAGNRFALFKEIGRTSVQIPAPLAAPLQRRPSTSRSCRMRTSRRWPSG